ncbi:MAG: dihydrolipoyl dehydrogenase [Puniceicoccaceae bacterium]|nr:MAG: dihydrolipoyl dehydrogenase [Puniceicoccaceae bacterium]
MAEAPTYDLVVIGGGPAGYAAAIRAGQLGKKVVCIEAERAGGTCLNWGCIPSKALLKSAELFHLMRKADTFGFTVGSIDFDYAKVIQRSRGVADKMARGIEALFRKNKVDYFVGTAQVNVPGMVEITAGKEKGKFFKTKSILLATGCKPRRIPGVKVDGQRVMTSREALANTTCPKSITILGAGAIGVEFAYFLNAFGCEVHLVEMLPQIVPVEDHEVSRSLSRAFDKQGIKQYVDTRAENIRVGKKSVRLELHKGDDKQELETEALLLAIGVTANLEGALSEKLSLKTDRGYLVVDDTYQTSMKGIYAAGDIIGPPWLAHVATYEAVQAVNGIFGHSKPRKVTSFPGCTYCQPQVASTGMTERAVKEKGIPYRVGKFPFTASGKAVAAEASEGFVKVISEENTGEILGVHIIGSDATELIAEYSLAIDLEASIDEIHHTIHAHPTLTEALAEAAAATTGMAIHI